ncbi:unnamed protein product [Cylicocyclus nassatus]|uniref:Uncharacterized protein n=1 Tax=Cylicocyclus nassatus TaxID=53992 RepID=A0AA36H3V2_CYLNA|nr:unnamed protein product [Cylicocyclus nassatus]
MSTWLLVASIRTVLCSHDLLYSLRGQDSLRRYHKYGLSNIYGIRSMHKRHVVPFPVIHTLDSLNINGTLIGENPVSAVFTVDPDIPEESLGSEKGNPGRKAAGRKTVPSYSTGSPENRTDIVSRASSAGHHNGQAIQLIEIRKVRRIGGGYPYGPKNFTVVEYIPPLRVEKSPYLVEEVIFKNYDSHENESTTNDPDDIWAVQVYIVYLKTNR